MRTKIIAVSDLTERQIVAMFGVMQQYYQKVTDSNFRRDLAEKKKVILLLGSDHSIKGFSTILESTLDIDGKSCIALYSGDTVLEKKYWGNGALAMAFGRYLVEVKLKNPLTPVYWFLISKGYKTYLLMSNNFPTHYPRFEQETPVFFQRMIDCFYSGRFTGQYDPKLGLIRVQSAQATCLRRNVAEITEALRRNKKIAFFEKRNPNWNDGVELACIAKVTLWIPLRYMLKRILKSLAPLGKLKPGSTLNNSRPLEES